VFGADDALVPPPYDKARRRLRVIESCGHLGLLTDGRVLDAVVCYPAPAGVGGETRAADAAGLIGAVQRRMRAIARSIVRLDDAGHEPLRERRPSGRQRPGMMSGARCAMPAKSSAATLVRRQQLRACGDRDRLGRLRRVLDREARRVDVRAGTAPTP